MNPKTNIHNPHLPGDSFFLEAGPVGILLIHGFTATTAEVRPLAEYLHQKNFTISAPLLPGHFTHPADLNKVHWQDWADRVEQAYQSLANKHSTVLVGGESMGGLLSLLLGANHPEIKALLLYAPALRLNISTTGRLFLRLSAPFIASLPKPNLDDNPYWQGYKVNPLKGTLQLLRFQEYIRTRLHQVQQPLLIVQGRKDKTVHLDTPTEIISSVSSEIKEVYWYDNSAHCVIIDQEMGQVNRLTLNFIQKIIL